MKKRIFALLLAAVMVLSLGMAAVAPKGTDEQTGIQTAEGAEKPLETTADVTEDTEVTENADGADDTDGTDDADTADDTDTGEADDDIASEDGAGETEDEVTVMSVSEPAGVSLATAAGKLTVYIEDNGLASTAGFELTTTDGTPVANGMGVDVDGAGLPGGPSFLSATLGIKINDDYTVREDEEVGPIRWSPAGPTVTLNDRSGDGAVTVQVMKRAAVNVSFSQSGCNIKEVRDPRSRDPKTYNSGDPVYADQTIILAVPSGYGVVSGPQYEAYQGGEGWEVDFSRDHLQDGEAVIIQVEKLQDVTIQVTGETDKLTYLALQGQSLTSGDTIQIGEKGVLQTGLESGFWIESSDEVDGCQTSRSIEVCDKDGNGTITLNVAARPAVTVEFKCPAGVSFDPAKNVMVIDKWASGGPQPFTGGTVYRGMVLIVTPPAGHCVVKEPGQDYFVRESGPGGTEYEVVLTTENLSGVEPVTITIAPMQTIDVIYTGETGSGVLLNAPAMVVPGSDFNVVLSAGYSLSVTEGGMMTMVQPSGPDNMSFWCKAYEDAESVTIHVTAAKTGAKINATGHPDALWKESNYNGLPLYNSGDEMPDGTGYVYLRAGYMIDIDSVTGGTARLTQIAFQGDQMGTGDLDPLYFITAASSEVTLPVVTPGYRWVTVTVNDPDACPYVIQDAVDHAMNGGTDRAAGSAFSGTETSVMPEGETMTIVLKGAGYELTAKSGCTVTGRNGVYTVTPDETGNTTVEVTIQKVTTPATATPAPTPVPTPNVSASASGTANDGQAKKQLESVASGMVDAIADGKTAGVSPAAAQAIQDAVKAGNELDVSTKLTVANVSAPADESRVTSVIGANDKVAQYLDISITMTVKNETTGTSVESDVTETGAPIDFAIELPDDLAGSLVYVVRVHDGAAEILPSTVKDGVIYFSSDKFSTYALVTTDDIAYAQVDPIPDQTWTGKAITPKPVVKANGKTLTEGTDYELSYEKNTDAGTATVVITGKAPYTGTKTATFKIVKSAASGSGSGTGTSPQTGDETPIALYAGILALSAGALALTVTRRKKTSR